MSINWIHSLVSQIICREKKQKTAYYQFLYIYLKSYLLISVTFLWHTLSSQLTRIKTMAIHTSVLSLTHSMLTPCPCFCRLLRALTLFLVSSGRRVVLTDHLAWLENLTKKGWLQTGSRKSCAITNVFWVEPTATTRVLVSRLLNFGSLVIITCFQIVAHIARYQTFDWHLFGGYYLTFFRIFWDLRQAGIGKVAH